MAYNAKTNWKYNDTPTESDLNRIEQGIKDLDDSVDSHKSALTLDHPDGSVTTSKLAAKSVTQDKLADKAVGSGQLADGAATDTVIGTRAIDDSVAAAAGADTPTRLWSKLANMVKGITGKSNWFTPPATTLEAVNSELSAKDAVPITIRQGVNIYNADRKSRLQNLQITGRTLVNLLGRDGNCEDASAWIDYQSTHAVSTDNLFIGTSSIKVTVSTGYTVASAVSNRSKVSLDASKYYLLAGRIKNGNATSGCFGVSGQSSTKTPVVTDTTKFGFTYKKFTGITTSSVGIEITATGAAGTYVFGDAVRLYEITKAEFDALDTMTADQIDAKYPYVDDVKSVNAIYINNPGKNLLPPFSEWNKTIDDNSVVRINGPYSLQYTKSTTTSFVTREIYNVTVAENQKYTFSVQVTAQNVGGTATYAGYYNLDALDKNGVKLGNINVGPYVTSNGTFTLQETITTPPGTASLHVVIGTAAEATGTFTWANPSLTIGTSDLNPFEPQGASYLYLPDCNLRSSVDGSVADQLYMRDGQPRAIRRFKEMLLDGSLMWYQNAVFTGYKQMRTVFANYTAMMDTRIYGNIVKYDGKIFTKTYGNGAADQQDWDGSTGNLFITISSADSGWGDAYSPTADEIKAYFNGWVMTNNFSGIYNGTGTKAWEKRYCGQGTPRDTGFGSTVVNGSGVISVPLTANDMGYTPYRLVYQLAQFIDEPINYEGSVMLHEGLNQIELGTSVVIRETLHPTYYSGNSYYYVNNTGVSGSLMKYRTSQISRVFKNGIIDKLAAVGTDANAYGKYHITFSSNNFDQSAAYSATYLALDTYLLGFAPVSISAEYAPNIKETVDVLTRDMVEAKTALSVLLNTKAQKQQLQWISPTLINGWVNYGDGSIANYSNASYYKDDQGIVRIKGTVKGGIMGSPMFYLPAGYRPKGNRSFIVPSNTGTGDTPGRITVAYDGSVFLLNLGSNTFVYLDCAFLAEQ